MKCVLINPPVHDFSAYDLWMKPFGLLVIANYLRSQGVEISLIDATDPHHPMLEGLPMAKRRRYGTGKFYAEEIPKPEIFKDVPRRYRRYGLPPDRLERAMTEAGQADAVLVTCTMTYWYPGAVEAIELARKVWPDAPVILGGSYATLCPDHARNCSGADEVVEGPFENSVGRFNKITGLHIDPPDVLVRPALDLYPRLEYAPVILSRGCPFRCTYCASGRLFDGMVRRNPLEVFEEIKNWGHNHILKISKNFQNMDCVPNFYQGITDFAFYDDALLWEPETGIVPLLEMVLEKDLKVKFHSPNGLHLSAIDKDLARLMRRAGFTTLRLGLESLSRARHDEWGGKADPDMLNDVAEALWEAGYERGEVGAYMLAGLPGQRAEELETDLRAVLKTGVRPYLAEYSPIPGTPMFEEAVKSSRYDLVNEPLTHNNSTVPCAGPEFTPDDLQRLKELTWPRVDPEKGS